MTPRPQPHSTYLNLDSIEAPPRAHREQMDAAELGALADSMAASGLHQPIGVRGPLSSGHYEIIWGHRRWTAAKMLQWPTIEAKVYPPDYDPLVARTEENGLHEPLNPREEAKIVTEFKERGHSLYETARLMRKSTAWVNGRLEILTYPPELQDAVASGALSLAVARELASIEHDGYRAELITEATRTGATARTAAAWRAHYEADKTRIESNYMTVQEILERREAYIITTHCESCRRQVELAATRLLRICADCNNELARAQAEEDRTGPTPAGAASPSA